MSYGATGSFSPWRVVRWLLAILVLATVAFVAAAAALLYTVGSMLAQALGSALVQIGAFVTFIAAVLAAVLLMLVLTTPLLPFAPWVSAAGRVVMMLSR